jgi:hypothetical protein
MSNYHEHTRELRKFERVLRTVVSAIFMTNGPKHTVTNFLFWFLI